MKKHFLLATMGVLIAGLCGICSCTAVREEAPQEGLFAEDVLCYVTTEDGVVTKTVNNGSATLWVDGDQLTAINISDQRAMLPATCHTGATTLLEVV